MSIDLSTDVKSVTGGVVAGSGPETIPPQRPLGALGTPSNRVHASGKIVLDPETNALTFQPDSQTEWENVISHSEGEGA